MEKLKIIVSHPAKQVIVYNRALAAERMGADVTLLTGLYYKPDHFPYVLMRWLPCSKRASIHTLLNQRRIDGLPPSKVVSLLGPLLESLSRTTRLLPLRRWWNLWDRLANLWLWFTIRPGNHSGLTILHCFQDCCLTTLRRGHSKGLITILEITLSPPLVSNEQLDAWGVTRNNFPDIERMRKELAEADFVLVQSEFGAKTIAAFGFPSDKIFHINLGLDTEEFVPRRADRRPGPIRVIFVGGISVRKGVHHLLQAWKELSLNDAELLLAGNHLDQGSPELLALAKDIPNCKILGHVRGRDLLDLYQQADFLVHPSLAEGGCAAIHEALGCGLPCVATSHSTSAVRNGCEGIIVPPGDIPALKDAIARLWADEELRKRMSVAARKRAEEALSLDAVCASSAETYRRIAELYSKGSSTGQHAVASSSALN